MDDSFKARCFGGAFVRGCFRQGRRNHLKGSLARSLESVVGQMDTENRFRLAIAYSTTDAAMAKSSTEFGFEVGHHLQHEV